VYYVSIPFQHCFHPFQNYVITIFSLITSFLTVSNLKVLADLLRRSVSVLNKFFFNTFNPMSIFPSRNSKCFPSLRTISVYLYPPKYIYSTVGVK
jgi:hypothetical protein